MTEEGLWRPVWNGRNECCGVESRDGLTCITVDDEPDQIKIDTSFPGGNVVFWLPRNALKQAIQISENLTK